MILSGELAGPTDVARFRSEAEAVACLDHLNILPIYEAVNTRANSISMKLVGVVLGDAMKDRSPAAIHRLVERFTKVCRAVHFAHQRGILHRDLKPGNILLDEVSGIPRVTDFGLAKKVEDDSGLTQSGAIVGTPSHMPPEQARGENT